MHDALCSRHGSIEHHACSSVRDDTMPCSPLGGAAAAIPAGPTIGLHAALLRPPAAAPAARVAASQQRTLPAGARSMSRLASMRISATMSPAESSTPTTWRQGRCSAKASVTSQPCTWQAPVWWLHRGSSARTCLSHVCVLSGCLGDGTPHGTIMQTGAAARRAAQLASLTCAWWLWSPAAPPDTSSAPAPAGPAAALPRPAEPAPPALHSSRHSLRGTCEGGGEEGGSASHSDSHSDSQPR